MFVTPELLCQPLGYDGGLRGMGTHPDLWPILMLSKRKHKASKGW